MTETHAGSDTGSHGPRSRTGMFRKDGGPEYAPEPDRIEGPTVATPVVDADLERQVLVGMQARQRERFGGGRIGAAFFGWIVAVGMTVLLTAVAAAVGAALFPELAARPMDQADLTGVGLWSAVTAVAVLALAYLAGGYVAGRMARFDGTRNGVLVWVVGAVLTVVVSLTGAIASTQMTGGLPRVLTGSLPIPGLGAPDLGMLTIGGIVVLVVALLVTLVAAAMGGRLGEAFHRRVDRAGISR